MSRDCTPFIPAKLDDADLTPHEFRVFCRISRRGDCTESVSKMASATGMHPDTVRRALRTLEEASMITRTPRPGTTSKHQERPPEEWHLTALEADYPSEKDGGEGCENEGGDKYHPSENYGGDPCESNGVDPPENNGGASKGTPLEGTPLEGSYSVVEIEISTEPPWWENRVVLGLKMPAYRRVRSGLPDDHPARSDRHLRYRKAAEWSLRLLLQAEEAIESFRVPAAVRRKAERNRIELLKDWQDIFRLLEEQDRHEWSDVRYAIYWLFTESDWLREGYIASMGSLRKKTSSGDQTKFESILTQARADSSYDGPSANGRIGGANRDDESPAERFERNRRAARRAVAAG